MHAEVKMALERPGIWPTCNYIKASELNVDEKALIRALVVQRQALMQEQ